MLAALVSVQIAGGLLLRGAWDPWAQCSLLLFLIAGWTAWFSAGVVRGRLTIPFRGLAAWAGALAALAFASALLGPVSAYALPSWACVAAGFWLIPSATLLSSDDRVRVEQAARAAAWVLVLLAVEQRLEGASRPTSALPNQNVFAGAILLLLPLAARRGDVLLAAGLVVCLWWTRSVGAWLGLAAAVVIHRRAVRPFLFWGGTLAGFVALVAIYAKLQSPETLHRWAWWSAAWRMAANAPWLGLGPGAFAYALPAYAPPGPELHSLFAHQHFLETAAERGWPSLLLWAGGLAAMLRRASPSRRFGPIAALVHGLVDYSLSVPGVFWLFCLSVGLALPESEESATVRAERKAPVLAVGCVFAWAAASWVAGNWRADRLRARAAAAPDVGEAESLLRRSQEIRPHPEAARHLAEIALGRAAAEDGRTSLEAAAAELEKAVSLDPYRASNWLMLESVYGRLGRPSDAAGARARAAKTCPGLRAA